MGFIDTALAVFLGNAITIAFGAALWQLNKHDYKAPWWAYGWVLLPMVALMLVLYSTEGPPPQFDALSPQPPAAPGR